MKLTALDSGRFRLDGGSLPEVVGRSIYMQMNAKLQAQAVAFGGPITYLDPEEARKVDLSGYQRAWELWKRKAMVKVTGEVRG